MMDNGDFLEYVEYDDEGDAIGVRKDAPEWAKEEYEKVMKLVKDGLRL